ncbi:hypothetical protein, partial [Xenorhabdus bovienii]|uniref:hypothetical protein n=1 Tax=Xenorhabdus bovienii TaxID=40576 RepID=UPI0009B8E838
ERPDGLVINLTKKMAHRSRAVFKGVSGAELIEARASLPILTPDRFKQAHHKSKSVLQKRG